MICATIGNKYSVFPMNIRHPRRRHGKGSGNRSCSAACSSSNDGQSRARKDEKKRV
jgi:hypothetical protein